jgi:hypothetical protein
MWKRCVPNCGACCFFQKGDTGPRIECDKVRKIEKVFGPRKNFAEKVGRHWFLKTVGDYDRSKIGVRSKLGGGTHVGDCPCVFLDTNNGHGCKIVKIIGEKFQPTTCEEWSCMTIGKKAELLQQKKLIDIGTDFIHSSIGEILDLVEKKSN